MTNIFKSKNKTILIISIILELILMYLFASLAINSGNLFWYLLFILFTLKLIKDFLTLVKVFIKK